MILQIQTPQFTGKINRAGHEHTTVFSLFCDLICFCRGFAYHAASAACSKHLSQMLRIFCPSVIDSSRCVGAAFQIFCQ